MDAGVVGFEDAAGAALAAGCTDEAVAVGRGAGCLPEADDDGTCEPATTPVVGGGTVDGVDGSELASVVVLDTDAAADVVDDADEAMAAAAAARCRYQTEIPPAPTPIVASDTAATTNANAAL